MSDVGTGGKQPFEHVEQTHESKVPASTHKSKVSASIHYGKMEKATKYAREVQGEGVSSPSNSGRVHDVHPLQPESSASSIALLLGKEIDAVLKSYERIKRMHSEHPLQSESSAPLRESSRQALNEQIVRAIEAFEIQEAKREKVVYSPSTGGNGSGQLEAGRGGDAIVSINEPQGDRLDLSGQNRVSSANEAPRVDVRELCRRLDIINHQAAQQQVGVIWKALAGSEEAKRNLGRECEALLALSATQESSWRLFSPRRSEVLAREVASWRTQMESAQPDTSTRWGSLRKKLIKLNDRMAGPLSTPAGKFALAVALAGMSSGFPAVIARRFLVSAFVTALISSYIGNHIFAHVSYPSSAISDQLQWLATNVGGYYIQQAIEENSKTHQG